MRILLALLLLIAQAPAHAGWQQTFADEFDGPVDFKRWQTTDHFGVRTYSGNGIQEMQCYDDAALSTANGNLVVSVTRQAMPNCPGARDKARMQYRSGRITSLNGFSQAYGYFETRMLFPPGQGFWPAFWLLPTSGFNWEIDVMEAVGKDPHGVYMNFHAWATGSHEGTQYRTPTPLSGGWHTYGLDWQPGKLTWYVDGVERFRTTQFNDRIPSTPGYILLNLAVGGAWPGDPDASTVIPNQMLVDYVRAWKRVNDGKPDAAPPVAQVAPPEVTPPAPLTLLRGAAADRSGAVPLQGAQLLPGDALFVFTRDDPTVRSVRFWLDSANPAAPSEPPTRTENAPPFDLNGTGADGAAQLLAVSSLATGLHTVTAQATGTDGLVRPPVTASFTVLPPPLDADALRRQLDSAAAQLDAARATLQDGLRRLDTSHPPEAASP